MSFMKSLACGAIAPYFGKGRKVRTPNRKDASGDAMHTIEGGESLWKVPQKLYRLCK